MAVQDHTPMAQLTRERRERRARQRLWVSLVLALVLHVVGSGLYLLLLHVEARSIPPPAQPVTLRPIDADQWAHNRGPSALHTPSIQPPKPKNKTPPPETHPKGQVVAVAPGNQQEAPDAKFLAESANRVDRETRAKEQTANYRNAQPQRTSATPQSGAGQDPAHQVAGNDGVGQDERPQRSSTQKGAMEIPHMQKRNQLALRLDPRMKGFAPSLSNRSERQSMDGNAARLKLIPGELGPQSLDSSAGRAGPHGPLNLMPSQSVLDKIAGAAPNDHLDVDEGEGTFLNTKEWKYAGFFNRVKQSVGGQWNPSVLLRQRDPTGETYSGRDRYTVLTVTLDSSGTLRDVAVEKSSGIEFLDQEAMASFRRAQPFPNPPAGLLSADSTLKFSFGFFLEMGSGSRMRLFRGNN